MAPLVRAAFGAAAALLLFATPAPAHRVTLDGPKSGLPIASVTHGQMAVLAGNRRAILALADDQYPTDPDMRRIQAFVTLQHFTCAFGLMPGSRADETSPFNECTHATLAGVRALFLHLKDMPGGRDAKLALARKIDIEMLDADASMVMCQFSDEPFNTADVIIPRLGAVVGHPTCLAVLFGFALAAFLSGAMVSLAGRRGEAGDARYPGATPETSAQ